MKPGSDPHLTTEFRSLVSTFAAPIRRLCAVYARDAADRDDLFQEIFLEIWRALPAFRGESSQRTWVYRIAHNVALTWQGRDTRSRPRRQPLDEARTHAADPTDLRRILLLEMISRLPPLDRQLVTLWLEGLSLKEIEKLVGIRAGTAAVRLTRVRQQLSRNVNATPGDTQWMNSNHPRN